MTSNTAAKNFTMKITRFSIGWLFVDVRFGEVERSVFISTVYGSSTLYEIIKNLTYFCPAPLLRNIDLRNERDSRYSIKYKDNIPYEFSIHWFEEPGGCRWTSEKSN